MKVKSLALLGLLASISAANAQIIYSSQTIPFSYIPNGTQALTFDKYDGNPLVLSGIDIIFSITKNGGSFFVDNESGSAASGNISQTLEADLSSGSVIMKTTGGFPSNNIGQNLLATSTYFASVTATIGDATNIFNSPGSDVDGTSFGTPVNTSTSGAVHSTWWSDYIGAPASTFGINVDGIQSTSLGALGGASTSTSPATLNGFVTVIYYVPEPSTAALAGLASIGLLFRRRRA